MAKRLDPLLIEILRKYDESAEGALWDCHGTWVVYHKAVERIAAKAGITFEMPQIIEANTAAKTVAIAVRGTMGDRTEWSFGEAAPSNNKNAYPYAMAEKRAKDRVVLKLVGLHGLAYSEEESDDFRPQSAAEQPAKREVGTNPKTGMRTAHSLKKEIGQHPDAWDAFEREIAEAESVSDCKKLALAWSSIAERDRWPDHWREAAREQINNRRDAILKTPAPDDDVFPGDIPPGENKYLDAMRAG